MFVIRNKKIFLTISATLVLASIFALTVFGLNVGIDFKGGSLLEVSYPFETVPPVSDVQERLKALDIGDFSLRPTGEHGFILRTAVLNEENKSEVIRSLSLDAAYPVEEERLSTVGPTIGTELRNKSYAAMAVVIIAIILFIAFAFRKVSRPVSSWKYGLIAVIALVHDVAIPTGVFALLGRFAGFELDVLFVMALLAILGYSVNDTIVVFDRVRENLRINDEEHKQESFGETVGKSLRQTYTRSINTSLTTLVVLLTLFFIGGPTIHNFVLTLIVGVIAGTYSSIFLASPLLVIVAKEN